MHSRYNICKKSIVISHVRWFNTTSVQLRDVRLKRNLFIYARYFQWLFKLFNLYMSSLSHKRSFYNSATLLPVVYKRMVNKKIPYVLFLTSKHADFFNILARGFMEVTTLPCYHLRWNPLSFFYLYSSILNTAYEFFPLIFVDSMLLKDSEFARNFKSIFIRLPIMFIGSLELSLLSRFVKDLKFFKKVYPLFIPSGYSVYMVLFWIRFMFKLV